jgi:hypothetical protein
MDDGWIKIHRQIQNHWIWNDPVKFQWWIDILFAVNYSDTKVNIGFKLFECKRGQSVKSLQTWADRWKTSKDTARNFLKLLEKDGMITHENIGKSTRITVCNYDDYQSDLHDSQTQSKRNPNAKPHKQERKEREEEKEIDIDFKKLAEYYNKELCPPLSRVTIPLSDSRKNAVRLRAKEHGKENVFKMLNDVLKSDFLLGDNDKSWKASFDWIFKQSNFLKIIEGNYDKQKKHGQPTESAPYHKPANLDY